MGRKIQKLTEEEWSELNNGSKGKSTSQTSIEWLVEQIKEYDFTPPSNNEEYVIVMPKWIFDAKIDEALEMH